MGVSTKVSTENPNHTRTSTPSSAESFLTSALLPLAHNMLLALLASMVSGGGAAAAPKGGCPRCDAKPTDHPDNPKKRKGKEKGGGARDGAV